MTEHPKVGLSSDLLRALGRITANFEAQSVIVMAYTACLIGPDQRVGQIVLADKSAGQVVETFGTLARYRLEQAGADEQKLQQIVDVVKRLRACEDARNTAVHSFWAIGSDGSTSRMKIPRPKGKDFRVVSEASDHDKLNVVADEIGATTEAFLKTVHSTPLSSHMPKRISFDAPANMPLGTP